MVKKYHCAVSTDRNGAAVLYERSGPRPYKILAQVKRLADFRSQQFDGKALKGAFD